MNAPTEAQCQSTIVQAARTLGYLVHHTRPAYRQSGRISTPIQGDAGFPDLVIAGHGRVWFVELKRKGNKPTDKQALHGLVVTVPEQQQIFIDYLTQIAQRKAS